MRRTEWHRTSAHAIPADKYAWALPIMHGLTIRRHKSDPTARPIEDHFVVAHCCSPNHSAIVFIVINAKAPDPSAHFKRVLRGWQLEESAASKPNTVRVEMLQLFPRHRVAIIVRVLALGRPSRASPPRTLGAEMIARGKIGCRG